MATAGTMNRVSSICVELAEALKFATVGLE